MTDGNVSADTAAGPDAPAESPTGAPQARPAEPGPAVGAVVNDGSHGAPGAARMVSLGSAACADCVASDTSSVVYVSAGLPDVPSLGTLALLGCPRHTARAIGLLGSGALAEREMSSEFRLEAGVTLEGWHPVIRVTWGNSRMNVCASDAREMGADLIAAASAAAEESRLMHHLTDPEPGGLAMTPGQAAHFVNRVRSRAL